MKYIITYPFIDSELESIVLDCVDDSDAVQRAMQHACWFFDIEPTNLEILNETAIALLPDEYNQLIVEPVSFNLTEYLGNKNAH
jgi:hypothetical protein